MRLPRGLRSLRNRLTVIVALIVAGAIGIVYLYVTPRLENQLTAQKLSNLEENVDRWAPILRDVIGTSVAEEELDRRVEIAARRSNAEVTVLGLFTGTVDQVYIASDASPGGVSVSEMRGLAEDAVLLRETVTDTVGTSAGRQALAATPLERDGEVRGVVVFADSLADVQANVSLIRDRILVAGIAALVVAAAAGYWVASRLTGRIKRLEEAARRLGDGDFSKPVPPGGQDELGQLADAFGDMQHQLSRLDTARKQFIASASHELRTPIFSLSGFLELLEDEELDEATRAQFLAQLRGQVDRMRKLATELLDLSRLESGALQLHPEPTDVGLLAREVAGEFVPAAHRHESELALEMGAAPIEIDCDPERVAQVIRVLLDNALVHTPPGTSIVVSATRRNGHVALEVTDTGPGIPRPAIEHVFEPFFTSANGARGAGLGLAIARELAERMDGWLTVRSTPGATAFELVLPA